MYNSGLIVFVVTFHTANLFIRANNLPSTLAIVLLYMEFIFLLRLWGRKIYNLTQVLPYYGLGLSGKNLVELIWGLAIGLFGILFLFVIQRFLGWLFFTFKWANIWACSRSFAS